MKYYVYILYSSKRDKYYVGYSSNIEERIRKHNTHHQGFTGNTLDWELQYLETYNTKEEAIKREQAIKRWKSRKRIEELIQKQVIKNSEHPDL